MHTASIRYNSLENGHPTVPPTCQNYSGGGVHTALGSHSIKTQLISAPLSTDKKKNDFYGWTPKIHH